MKEKIQGVLQDPGLDPGASTSINTTDRDCRPMKSRQGSIAGYNLQAVVDDHQGLIVQADVVNDQNDVRQFATQIAQANLAPDPDPGDERVSLKISPFSCVGEISPTPVAGTAWNAA